MKKIKIYEYKNCGTCKKALRFLDQHKIVYEKIPIREQPPTLSELKQMLKDQENNLRKLFNTSGLDYKSLNLKEKLPSMTNEEAFKLLSSNGNLVKRPFVVSEKKGLVGFQEEEWKLFFK